MKRSCLLECPVCGIKKRYYVNRKISNLTKCKHCSNEIVIKYFGGLNKANIPGTYIVGKVSREYAIN